ncbi:MAG TPA: TetR/AcrR family transcriptional regulator [Streptosporangiaceae bacterium]|nr:TetR/AcrR family transcriptional regulator [Streptosporangiaceae bacterium]
MPRPRRELQSAESIVDIATELFYRQGYEATSMQDIATAAKINKSSLYHHIRGKEEILEVICNRAFAQLTGSLERSGSGDAGPGERVLLAFAGAARTALADPRGTAIIIRLQGKSDVARRVLTWRREYEQRFADLIEAAQKAGEVRGDIEAAMLARLVLGLVNWVVEWFEPRGRSYSASSVEAAVVAVAAHGLAGDGGHLRSG